MLAGAQAWDVYGTLTGHVYQPLTLGCRAAGSPRVCIGARSVCRQPCVGSVGITLRCSRHRISTWSAAAPLGGMALPRYCGRKSHAAGIYDGSLTEVGSSSSLIEYQSMLLVRYITTAKAARSPTLPMRRA